jgi:hypothetical protein
MRWHVTQRAETGPRADAQRGAGATLLSPWQLVSDEAKGRRRRLFLAVGGLFALVTLVFGFPTGREVITGWVLLVLLAACGGEWAIWRRSVLHDWAPLLGVLFAVTTSCAGRPTSWAAAGRTLTPALDYGQRAPRRGRHRLPRTARPQLRRRRVALRLAHSAATSRPGLAAGPALRPGDVQWDDVLIAPGLHVALPGAGWRWRIALWLTPTTCSGATSGRSSP